MKHEYVNSAISIVELSKKNEVSADAVYKESARDGWVEERERVAKEIDDAAQAAQIEKRTKELIAFNEEDLKSAKAIRYMAQKILSEALKCGVSLPGSELRAVAASCEAAQRIGRLALGMSTDNMEIKGSMLGNMAGGVMVVRDHGDDAGWRKALATQQENLLIESESES